MASYQNTSGYFCGTTMNTHPGHCPNPNVYFNQNPTNFHTHAGAYYPENYINQEAYPKTSSGGSIYNPAHRQNIMYNNGNVYGHVPQYNTIQNTPLTQEPVSHTEPRPHHKNQCMARKHYVQILILPSSKGTFKAQIKRKRQRTIFTTEQVEALEEIFNTKQYITREERFAIVNQLKLSDKSVKIWFQNRRLKDKKMQSQDCNEPLENSAETNSPVTAVLKSLESEINKNTDENGFVSVDDGVMKDLATVIDDLLTTNNVKVPLEEMIHSDSSPLYEPISPASVSDSNDEDNFTNWRPSEPNKSLNILFDLQTMPLM